MRGANPTSNRQAEFLELHNRLLSDDPVATNDIFEVFAPELERHLRIQFPNLWVGVDPNIYLSAAFDALTDYFKNPSRYDPSKSGLMTYLRMVAKRDMQNLLRKEERHTSRRTPLDSVEFTQSDGNDVSERVAEEIDGRRMIEKLRQGMTPVERTVFSLMLEGERSSAAAAEAMGIGHLPSQEMAREVKRVKDRIKKRAQRSGIALR